MNKKALKLAYCLLIAGCLSCSETLKPEPITFYKTFTGDDHKSWSIQYVVFKQVGKGDQKFSLSPCGSDDQYIFYANSDHTYEVNNNGTTCPAADGVSYSLTDSWSFVNATAKLTIIIPAFSDIALQFFIRSIDDRQMVLEIFSNQDNTASYQLYFAPSKN